MMVFWKGWGILGLLIPMLVSTVIYSMGLSDSLTSWINCVCLLLSGAAVWFIGKRLNNRKDEVYSNVKTGALIKLGNQHTLFFIPLQYWAFVCLIYGVGSLFN